MNPSLKWLALALGGVLGTFSRYCLSQWVHEKVGASFPWGTMAVNTIGCLAAGFLFGAVIKGRDVADPGISLFWVTGFCGAFTTFSALILETSTLADGGRWGASFLNVAAGLVLGFGAFMIGRRLPALF